MEIYRVFQKSLYNLDMLEQFLFPQFGENDHEGRMHFRQDGAPPHYNRDIRNCLNTRFPGQWIGRAAPTPWPPCSPDLTALDFFLVAFCQRPSVPATPTCKCRRAPNSNYHRSCRSDARD
ncbi:hypothetical protein Cfor_00314, partial [Coptotermes formosanus]